MRQVFAGARREKRANASHFVGAQSAQRRIQERGRRSPLVVARHLVDRAEDGGLGKEAGQVKLRLFTPTFEYLANFLHFVL